MSTQRTVAVEGVEIPEAMIALEAQNHPSLSAGEAWETSAKALALRALLLARACEIGLEAAPQLDETGREETEEEALIRTLLDQEVEVPPSTLAERRRVYDAHADRFLSPLLFEASHILFEPQTDGATGMDEARGKAERAIAALEAGASFAELARALSDCPSGAEDGRLGQLSPGDLAPEVERALLELTEGATTSRPVRSRFGWHVLRLDRRAEPRRLPFEEVEDRIALHLESRAWAAVAARYAAGLAEKARLKGLSLKLTPDGGFSSEGLALGDLLEEGGPAARTEAWLEAVDPALGRRVRAAAEAAGEGVQDYIRQCVSSFVAEASDERWTQLLSAAQGAEDPALTAIGQILRSKLEPVAQTFTLIRRRGE
ncbi:peptidylprolyl isomerase [Phenylobacterium koreense]|uniref:Parvulin-like PPIase n=1 Tax=Phenylobacterium koreense TaxID=266125 RepID=A0ABV2ELP3_9CAUL